MKTSMQSTNKPRHPVSSSVDVCDLGGGSGPPRRYTGSAKNLWVKKNHHTMGERMKIATYNVRTLLKDEHVQELEEELKENNMKWELIGLGEVRRKEEIFTTLQSGHLLYHSQANNRQAGVSFLVNKTWKDNMTRVSSGNSHGTGIRNNSGQRLLEFCSANDLFVTNTGFRHHLRHKTTWNSPDGRTNNEIDYILIRSRFKSFALNCRAYPKADCGSDHNIVAARLRLRFTAKKAITTTHKVRWNVDKLQEEAQHEAYNEELAHVLRNTQSASTIDNQWETIKTTITIAAKATIGKREMTAKQKWITPRTLELMEERKQLKPLITRSQEDKERYSLKDKEVRHACEEDKKDYLEGICLHLQDCKHLSQAGIAYKYIRGLKKPFTLRSRTNKDAQDRRIDDTDEIRERWRGYTESLYTKDQTIHADWLAIPSIVVDPVPAVLPAEVTKTIRHVNNNKAPGSDDLNIELIKAIDDDSKMMAQLTHLCNQIITEGKWPAELRGSIYVPNYKKGDKMDCKNYITIALIPHASKIVLGIIHQRMLSYYEQELSETQAGFRKDNGTRDQILNMRLICEKQIEHSKNVYCCFIDYSKAFDCVDFELMWRTLLSFGIPKYIVECLKDLYQNQTAEVETAVGRT